MTKSTYYSGMKVEQTTFWTAFYTKSRNEKKIAERLSARGYEIFCPMRTVLKQWSDRKKKVKEPVFTSYIFARVDEAARMSILNDSGIVCNVHWLGNPVKIRDCEINEIRAFLEEHSDAVVSSLNFRSGDHIEINSGPLSGSNGVISEVRGGKAFLLIRGLGIEMKATVGVKHLKKVG